MTPTDNTLPEEIEEKIGNDSVAFANQLKAEGKQSNFYSIYLAGADTWAIKYLSERQAHEALKEKVEKMEKYAKALDFNILLSINELATGEQIDVKSLLDSFYELSQQIFNTTENKGG